MKKYHSLLIVLIGILMFSCCSNNDDDLELSVIGGWTVTESKLNDEIVTNQSVIRLLTADNRLEFIYHIYIGSDIELRIEEGSWTKTGNILSIDFDNSDMDPILYSLTELSSTSMTWELEILGEGTLIETLTR